MVPRQQCLLPDHCKLHSDSSSKDSKTKSSSWLQNLGLATCSVVLFKKKKKNKTIQLFIWFSVFLKPHLTKAEATLSQAVTTPGLIPSNLGEQLQFLQTNPSNRWGLARHSHHNQHCTREGQPELCHASLVGIRVVEEQQNQLNYSVARLFC